MNGKIYPELVLGSDFISTHGWVRFSLTKKPEFCPALEKKINDVLKNYKFVVWKRNEKSEPEFRFIEFVDPRDKERILKSTGFAKLPEAYSIDTIYFCDLKENTDYWIYVIRKD